jgi:hypothetical protein
MVRFPRIEGIHICDSWNESYGIINEGKKLRRAEGIERGSAISLINFVEKYMNRHNSSLENTLQILDVSMEDYLKAKSIVEQDEVTV